MCFLNNGFAEILGFVKYENHFVFWLDKASIVADFAVHFTDDDLISMFSPFHRNSPQECVYFGTFPFPFPLAWWNRVTIFRYLHGCRFRDSVQWQVESEYTPFARFTYK